MCGHNKYETRHPIWSLSKTWFGEHILFFVTHGPYEHRWLENGSTLLQICALSVGQTRGNLRNLDKEVKALYNRADPPPASTELSLDWAAEECTPPPYLLSSKLQNVFLSVKCVCPLCICPNCKMWVLIGQWKRAHLFHTSRNHREPPIWSENCEKSPEEHHSHQFPLTYPSQRGTS